MAKGTTYFLDWDYDQIKPLEAKTELVDKYEKMLKKKDARLTIDRFKTRQELLNFSIKEAKYAHDGGCKFKKLSDDEMEELIEGHLK